MSTFFKNMHYILNTTLTVPVTIGASRIGGPTIPGQTKQVNKISTRSLRPGVFYTLMHIRKDEEGVKYIFKGNDGTVTEEAFANCNEADKFIANIKGETLPDYEKFYNDLSS